MNKKIIFATGNAGKMKEIRAVFSDFDGEILSMKEAGVDCDIEENGTSFEENALIKAKAIWERTRAIVLADDSGLEVDYLNKEPGIYSARYMGENTSYDIKNQSLIDRLKGVEDEKRTARFVCAIAAAFPDGSVEVTRGTIEGRIGYEEKGSGGFGYDPLFLYEPMGKTFAEMNAEEKNSVSHRARAMEKFAKLFAEVYY